MTKKDLTLEKLIELTIKEATKLRKTATQEELDRLRIEWFMPSNREKCIYGQMTGSCDSRRAVELIQGCNSRVLDSRDYFLGDVKLGGKPSNSHRYEYFTPLEMFIGLRVGLFNNALQVNQLNGNNKILIDFLKDKKIKKLVFNEIDLEVK
jgi:hypothetical protein